MHPGLIAGIQGRQMHICSYDPNIEDVKPLTYSRQLQRGHLAKHAKTIGWQLLTRQYHSVNMWRMEVLKSVIKLMMHFFFSQIHSRWCQKKISNKLGSNFGGLFFSFSQIKKKYKALIHSNRRTSVIYVQLL